MVVPPEEPPPGLLVGQAAVAAHPRAALPVRAESVVVVVVVVVAVVKAASGAAAVAPPAPLALADGAAAAAVAQRLAWAAKRSSCSTGLRATDMKFARVINNVAYDVRADSPEGFFHPDVAAQFSEVPNTVQEGWVKTGTKWAAPESPPVPEPTDPTYITVSPVQFKLLFTVPERVAITGARAGDAILDDFYTILDDPRLTMVDFAIQGNRYAVEYLAVQGLIAPERVQQIIRGEYQ